MIREFKATIKPVTTTSCDVFYEARDNYGAWQKQGIAPRLGTAEQVRDEVLAQQTRWGWTPYDPEEENILTFWKEF